MGLLTRALIFLFLATASFAAQEKHAVLLDRSGSMKSYYDIQVIQDSARAIQEVLQTHGNVDLFGFSTEVKGARNLAEIGQVPFGQFTYLDRALDYAITRQYAIVWMITDNVQDQPGAAEAGNTEIFYRRLRSNAVKRVVIFPLLQAPGRAGLVIYALLLGDSDQEYEKEIAEFVKHANGLLKTEPLRMKPLDRDTIEVSFVRTQAQPGRKRVTYDAGQPISEQMEIRFKSKFEHLEIADAKIEVLKASPGFQKRSLLSSDKREIAITPDKITIGAGDETQQIYRVSIDLGVVRLRRGLSTLWQAAWGKSSEDAVLDLVFLIQVPQENFKLRKSFLNTYHAPTLDAAKASGKIYAVNSLPGLMGEPITAIRVESSIPYRVKYPWWPALMWILVILVGLGIVIGVLVLVVKGLGGAVSKAKNWDVAATADRGVRLLSSTDAQKNVLVQGDRVGRLDNNAFLPATGVRIEGHGDKVDVSKNPRIKVLAKGRTIFLAFSEKAEAGPGAARTPTKR